MDTHLRCPPSQTSPLVAHLGDTTSRGAGNLRMLFIEGEAIKSNDIFNAAAAIQEAKAKQALAEKAAARAETSNKAKSDSITNMIHEIRTPLAAIIGLATILDKAQLDDRNRECLDMLQSCAEDLMKMINGSLDIDRLESQKLNLDYLPFDMHALLQHITDVTSFMTNKKNIGVRLIYDPGLPTLFIGDSGRIRQIVMNLVGNAIKFTETGSVTISFTADRGANGKDYISIGVTDTGIGIPKDKIDVVFDRFVQADSSIVEKFGGSGLGLSISKALAESMGGTLTVTSILGKGSAFTLNLHLSVPQAAPI